MKIKSRGKTPEEYWNNLIKVFNKRRQEKKSTINKFKLFNYEDTSS